MPAAPDTGPTRAIGDAQRARFRADLAALDIAPPLAVAVSGGPDSIALLLLTAASFPGEAIAATVDHGLRAGSAAEAAAVAAVCARIGVPHVILAVRVDEDGTGVQAAARRARYAALDGWAGEAGATLLTAHHRDDQAETILMRIARGAGIAGLAGVRSVRRLNRATLARPLLGWGKAELAAIVQAAGIPAADDPSNRDERFDRTRARELLGRTSWLDPARLAGLAPMAAEWNAALAFAADLAAARLGRDGAGAITLDPTGIPREIRRRLLLRVIAELAPAAPTPRGPALMRLISLLEARKTATLAGLRFAPGPPWRITRARPRRSP